MDRTRLITAVLCTAFLAAAACNRAYTNTDAGRPDDSGSTAPLGERPVGTSGQPADQRVPLDDASVTSRIQARYFLDQAIKGRRIDVDTRDGIVTLRGDVASDNERAQALLLARTTPGVERVEDALMVNMAIDAPAPPTPTIGELPTPANASDETLTALVQSRLAADPSLEAVPVEVTAKDGVLLLDGAVTTTAVKQRVLSVARGTEGVVQVVDRIRIGRAR